MTGAAPSYYTCYLMAKILVVDDDPDLLELLSFHLGRAGHEARCARGGADGLERAAYDRPDIVLLDVRMPIVDGVRVLQILRQNPLTRHVGVVLMSAGSFKDVGPRLGDDARVRCLEKPLDFGRLRAAIQELLPSSPYTSS